MEYLCKPLPTKADLRQVRKEQRELRVVVENYISGKGTRQEFLRAKRRIDDLYVLVTSATKRVQRSRLKLIPEAF